MVLAAQRLLDIVSSTFHQPSHTSIATTEHIDKLEVDLYNKLNGRITELDLSLNRRLDELKSLIELAIMSVS